MSEPATPVTHYLEYHAPRMWKGELEFTSRKDNEPVATLLITQITGHQDLLRMDWNGARVADLDRCPFHNWLRAGELDHAAGSQPFTVDQATWLWRGRDLHVTVNGIEHVFPATALYELRTLAVR